MNQFLLPILLVLFTIMSCAPNRTSRYDEFVGGTYTGTSATLTTVSGGNLQLSGNSLISTDTDGNINLNPDGSGLTIFTDLTATTVPYLGSSKEILSSAVTPTELGYLSGVTSALQTQLNAKIDDFSSTTDNALVRTDGTSGAAIQDSGITIDDSDVMSGVTQLNVDNLRLDGNTISSTDANGDITLTPNGAGEVDSSSIINLLTESALRFQDNTGGEYVGFKAPTTVSSSVTFTLPSADGTTGQALKTNGSGTLSWGDVSTSGGTGSKNYFSGGDFEANIDIASVYNDPTNYTDGTGGTVAGLSITQNSTTPLAGTYDLKLTKAATDSSADGLTLTTGTLDKVDRGRNIFIEFEWDGTDSNYTDGDLELKVYSTGTDATILPVVALAGLNDDGTLPKLKTKIVASVPTSTNTDATLRISLHLASDSATGATWSVYIEDARAGPAGLLALNSDGPIGEIIAHSSETVPENFLYADGSAVSRTTYAELFAVIGTTYGYGNNSTTFNVPDLRGRFLRGQDDGSSRDPDDTTRTAMNTGGNTGDNIGSVQDDQMGEHNHQWIIVTDAATTDQSYNSSGVAGNINVLTRTGGSHIKTFSSGTETSVLGAARNWTSNVTEGDGTSESRPKNANVRYYIRYRKNSNVVTTNELGLQTIHVSGRGNGGTALTADTTNIDFTEVTDSHNAWNGTIFTAPKTGKYRVEGTVRLTTSVNMAVKLYVNGTETQYLNSTGITANVHTFSWEGVIQKDDQISFRAGGASPTLSNNLVTHYINIASVPDFTLYGAYQEKNKIQTKTLAADQTSDAVMSNLTFSNLVTGKWYQLGGQMRARLDNSASDGDVSVTISHNSSTIGTLYFGINEGTDTSTDVITNSINIVFKAAASTVTFTTVSASAAAHIQGNGTQQETFVQLIERNDLIETDEY